MLNYNRSLILGYMLGLFTAFTFMTECALAETEQGLGPQSLKWVLPDFQCELERVKAGGDSTTRGRQIRRIKRTYKKCISDYKTGLAAEQQALRESLPSIREKETVQFVIAKIDLIQRVLKTEYRLPKVLGAGGNSIDARDFYDIAHGH